MLEHLTQNTNNKFIDRNAYRGKVAESATGFNQPVNVVIDAIDNEVYYHGPCRWMPRGNDLPAAGDECLIVFDEQNEPWVVNWWGATAIGGVGFVDVSRSGTQTFTGSATKVEFNLESADADGFFNTTNFRYLPVGSAGRFRFDTTVTVAAMTAGSLLTLQLAKNGAVFRKLAAIEQASAAVNNLSAHGGCDVELDGVDDYVEIFVSHTDGSTDRPIQSGPTNTWLQASLVGHVG